MGRDHGRMSGPPGKILRILKDAAAVIWPPRCLVCGRPLGHGVLCLRCRPESEAESEIQRCFRCFSPAPDLDGGGICPACRLFPPPFDRLRHLWRYHGEARDLITIMKYRPSRALCLEIGRALAGAAPVLFGPPDWGAIVPVPASAASLRRRSFNQCLLFARAIRGALGSGAPPVRLDALRHFGRRPSQASLSRSRRIVNIRGAFSAEKKAVSGLRLLLVDDVITTGATAASAAIALLEAGAAGVDLIAAARAAAWQQYRWAIYSGIRGCAR